MAMTSSRFLLVPALVLALAACGETPAERLALADAAFARQDYGAARVALVAALREEPGNLDALTLLARTQLRLDDAEGAALSIRQLDGKLAAPELARMQAELLLLQGRGEQALAVLQPGDASPAAWRIRAAARLAAGDEVRAEEAFTQGMAAGGEVRLATEYARHLLRSGRLEEAAAVHRQMQRFAGGAFETIVLEGDLAAARGQRDQARAAFRRAAERYPHRHEPLLALAMQLQAAGNGAEALAMVERADELASDAPEVLDTYVQVLSEQGAWAKVRAALVGRESTLDPTSSLGQTYGEALLRTGQPEQARALFARARLLLPRDPYVRFMLGEAQMATRDPQAAWQTLAPLAASVLAPEEVIRAAQRAALAVGAPESAALERRLQPARLRAHALLVDRAQDALLRQDWRAASAALAALPGGSEDPEVLVRLALAASRLDEHGAAIGYADRALEHRPNDAGYLHAAGLARYQAGDREAARDYLEKAIEADPRDAGFRRDLARARAPLP